MNRSWTFGRKLAAGYAIMVALTIAISAGASYALRTTVDSKDEVINRHAQILIEAQRLDAAGERTVSAARGYVIGREQRSLNSLDTAKREVDVIIERIAPLLTDDTARLRHDSVQRVHEQHSATTSQLIDLVQRQIDDAEIERFFEDRVMPSRDQFSQSINQLISLEEDLLAQRKQAATDAAERAGNLLLLLAGAGVAFAIGAAWLLTRILSRQIGTAVGHVQSSSAELQAAASQQAGGAKEQANAMNEISTTISELVATSRQIAESAQHVAQIAEQTAAAANHGETTVATGQDSIAGIRRQVDAVVNHMLDLGKKSQEIGAVLDIVAELAEQTNILAINATIEASGAGESGRRFGVVADEIRKLADRVGNSTKEIRALIDDVRAAVNTTVMATEGSAKAVEAGTRQFVEVAVAFRQIAAMVSTTTDAASEIELSTRQQATAAEQVRTAVSEVAQATHETEASTGQTLQTASQLASLSKDLLRLIQPQPA